MAWTQRDGADNKVRHEQNKVRHGQNRKQIFVLSPAFHYLCGETDAGPAGRMPGKFCADTHLRTVYAVFAINLRYEGRETDTCHQRRRLRFERTCGGRGGRARLRPRGRGGARNDAERHEPSHHDVQPAVPALCAEGRGAEC